MRPQSRTKTNTCKSPVVSANDYTDADISPRVLTAVPVLSTLRTTHVPLCVPGGRLVISGPSVGQLPVGRWQLGVLRGASQIACQMLATPSRRHGASAAAGLWATDVLRFLILWPNATTTRITPKVAAVHCERAITARVGGSSLLSGGLRCLLYLRPLMIQAGENYLNSLL